MRWGLARETAPTDSVELKPPPFGCDGGCSSVVPSTITMLVPLPQGGRSTVAVTEADDRGRKSAMPEGAGKVVRSTTRKRRRVILPPLSFLKVKRRSSVPNVELFGGSLVKSRTMFGGAILSTQVSRPVLVKESPLVVIALDWFLRPMGWARLGIDATVYVALAFAVGAVRIRETFNQMRRMSGKAAEA